jgi:phosphoserine phosphatase SerB
MAEPRIFTWISPIIPQKELEGIYHWFNHQLIEAGLLPLPSFTRMQTRLNFDPEESLTVEFELPAAESDSAFERFRESLWSGIFAGSHPAPRPHLASLRTLSSAKSPKRLACFDMDSTLINEEVIDEIARAAGFYAEVAAVTEEAMQGKLDFTASLQKRVRFFAGMPKSKAEAIIDSLTFSPGAEKLVAHLKAGGTKTAVVSGGFEFILTHFQEKLGLDHAFGNVLFLDEEIRFTGELDLPVVDAARKRTIVAELKAQSGLTPQETMVIGDGANDLEMMKEAGTQVSFCGKAKLAGHCNTLVFNRNLLWLKQL